MVIRPVVALYGDLGIVGPRQAGMAAWSVAGDTGMVDDHDDAAEGPLDGVGRLDEAAHVLVLVLAAVDGAIERVDNDDGGRLSPEVRRDVGDQRRGVTREIDLGVNQVERHILGGDALVFQCTRCRGWAESWKLSGRRAKQVSLG